MEVLRKASTLVGVHGTGTDGFQALSDESHIFNISLNDFNTSCLPSIIHISLFRYNFLKRGKFHRDLPNEELDVDLN